MKTWRQPLNNIEATYWPLVTTLWLLYNHMVRPREGVKKLVFYGSLILKAWQPIHCLSRDVLPQQAFCTPRRRGTKSLLCQISRSSGGIFSNTSLPSAMYYYMVLFITLFWCIAFMLLIVELIYAYKRKLCCFEISFQKLSVCRHVWWGRNLFSDLGTNVPIPPFISRWGN